MTVLAQRIRRYVELSGRMEGAAWLARARAAIDSGQDLSAADLAAAIALLLPLTPPDFALRCGREERLSDLGTVGHAIASSRTLEQALSIWSAHSGDIDPLMHFRIHVRGESWRTEFTASTDLSPAVRRFLAEEWLSNFFTFLKEVTALVDPAARIELRHPPAFGLAYELWLPVRPEFRRAANRLTLSRSLLATPLRSRNDEMLDLILRHFRDRPAAPAPWSEQVRRTLTSHAADTP
ncbi:MAG: AraC family transcriptional regulator ligand-binding domain-containing protein, partial [Novosphingobium sp.]